MTRLGRDARYSKFIDMSKGYPELRQDVDKNSLEYQNFLRRFDVERMNILNSGREEEYQ
jgi:hypothetical protein